MEFGIWFVLWLIVAFGGYMISVFIAIAGMIFWSIALVIRLKHWFPPKIRGRMHQTVTQRPFLPYLFPRKGKDRAAGGTSPAFPYEGKVARRKP